MTTRLLACREHHRRLPPLAGVRTAWRGGARRQPIVRDRHTETGENTRFAASSWCRGWPTEAACPPTADARLAPQRRDLEQAEIESPQISPHKPRIPCSPRASRGPLESPAAKLPKDCKLPQTRADAHQPPGSTMQTNIKRGARQSIEAKRTRVVRTRAAPGSELALLPPTPPRASALDMPRPHTSSVLT